MSKPKWGATRRHACGCLSQYGAWDRSQPNTPIWAVQIKCAEHRPQRFTWATHLRAGDFAACGYWHGYVKSTRDTAAVSCGNCKRSDAYLHLIGAYVPQGDRARAAAEAAGQGVLTT